MKKIQSIVIFLYIYLVLLMTAAACFLFFLKFDWITIKIIPILFFVWLIFFIYSLTANIKSLRTLFKENNLTELKKNCKTVKLGLIPFWIFHFITSFSVMIVFLGGSRGIGFIFIPIPLFFTYLILLVTSIFSMPFIVSLYKNKQINSIVIHIILQLCFILDIVDILYLLNKIKKNGIEEMEN